MQLPNKLVRSLALARILPEQSNAAGAIKASELAFAVGIGVLAFAAQANWCFTSGKQERNALIRQPSHEALNLIGLGEFGGVGGGIIGCGFAAQAPQHRYSYPKSPAFAGAAPMLSTARFPARWGQEPW